MYSGATFCHNGWRAVGVKIKETLVRPQTLHSRALYSQIESRYFEWQKQKSYSYSDEFISWIPTIYPQMMSAESLQSIWHYLNRWLCIVRSESLAIDHHWAPLSAYAAADNHSSSSLSEELLMWSDAQTGRLFAGGWERSTKESHIETAAD